MITFNQKINEIKNIKILEECFDIMIDLGVEPIYFMDWFLSKEDFFYTEEALQEGLLDQFRQGYNQSSENPYVLGGFANKLGQYAGRAANYAGRVAGQIRPGEFFNRFANNTSPQNLLGEKITKLADSLDYLSRRLASSEEFRNKFSNPNFQNDVLNLRKMLLAQQQQQQSQSQQQRPIVNPNVRPTTLPNRPNRNAQPEFGALADSINYDDLMFLKSQNIDPVGFVNWYINEALLDEGIFDTVKNWGLNQWQNISNKWKSWRKNTNDSKNKQAEDNVIAAMNDLLKYIYNGNRENINWNNNLSKLIYDIKSTITKQANNFSIEPTN